MRLMFIVWMNHFEHMMTVSETCIYTWSTPEIYLYLLIWLLLWDNWALCRPFRVIQTAVVLIPTGRYYFKWEKTRAKINSPHSHIGNCFYEDNIVCYSSKCYNIGSGCYHFSHICGFTEKRNTSRHHLTNLFNSVFLISLLRCQRSFDNSMANTRSECLSIHMQTAYYVHLSELFFLQQVPTFLRFFFSYSAVI